MSINGNFLVLVCLIFSPLVSANLSSLSKELFQENTEILKKKQDIKLAELDLDLLYKNKPWSLSLGGEFKDINLESSSSFSSQDSSTLGLSAGIKKRFLWGGEFEFNNVFSRTDRGDGDSSQLSVGGSSSSSNLLYNFTQSFSYTQDLGRNFLGRDFYKEIDISKLVRETKDYELSQLEESKATDLFQRYVDAALKKGLIQLEQNALARSQRRTQLIRNWVKDGLKQKVDLLQAEMTEINQKEMVESANLNFKTSLSKLSELIHREVKEDEVISLNQGILSKEELNLATLVQNKNIKVISQKMKELKESRERTNLNLLPTVKAGFIYKTNEYDDRSGKSLSRGFFWGPNKEYVISVAASWPLGFDEVKNQKEKINVELKKLDIEKSNLLKNLKTSALFLEKEINILEKNIVYAKGRLELSRRVLVEYNKLYDLGRADLDTVIRAEEGLINNEKSYLNYLKTKEDLLSAMLSLKGVMKGHLLKISPSV